MKIRHLNCVTIHTHLPYPGVTHCLLLEGAGSHPHAFHWIDRGGYVRRLIRPDTAWQLHSTSGEAWFGMPCVCAWEDAAGEILLVPLEGHSPGHCGVAVNTGRDWLLHCGDAFVREMQIDVQNPLKRRKKNAP